MIHPGLKRFIFWIMGISLAGSLPAQNPDPSFVQSLSIAGSIHYGFTNPANIKLESIQDGHSFLGELDISSQTNGRKAWQQSSGYPAIGLEILYGRSGSLRYIGHVAAFLPYINGYFVKEDYFRLGWRFGLGPGWVEKPFNAQTNVENLVIGSHLNACFNLQLYSGFRIWEKFFFNLGLSFTHLSNGSVKLPNLGLNMPALSAGLTFYFDPNPKRIRRPLPPIQKKWDFFLITFAAIKQAPPVESPLGWVNGLSFEALKRISQTGRMGGGFNLTYDQTLRTEVPNSVTFAFDESKLKLEASLYGSYEYGVGNLSIPIQLGAYLYNNYRISEIYEIIGIKWRISPHWIACLGLKAHVAKADFIQWGIGYKL
jgi:hypothetical protein